MLGLCLNYRGAGRCFSAVDARGEGRLRWFGLTYGDAGLFTRRSSYEAVGGFRPVALFEDVELIGRLRRHGRLMDLPFPLEASSRRFQGRLWRTWLRWISLQALYLLGVSPDRLARWYGRSAGLPPAVGRARASEMDSEDP